MKDLQGQLYNPKLVNAVPATSRNVVIPEHLKESGLSLRNEVSLGLGTSNSRLASKPAGVCI